MRRSDSTYSMFVSMPILHYFCRNNLGKSILCGTKAVIPLTVIFLLSAAVPVAKVNAEQDATDAVIESSRVFVPAKPIEKAEPRYPKLELRYGRQGWVRITYCIDESGSTQNVSVSESVGQKRFEGAAIETVKQWKFDPALVNGKPSWQSRNLVLITFALEEGNTGARINFIKKYRRIGELIDQQNFEEADKLFWHVHETYDLSLYEFSKLWAQRVRYEQATGDIFKMGIALNRATASNGEWIDEESYVNLLTIRVPVELNNGQYYEAMRTYRKLIKATGEDAEEVLELQPTMERLQDMIIGDEILKISAKVRSQDECYFCNNSWAFTPVRADFSFANITGILESIEMRCDHKRFESAVSDTVEWHIPDNWGTCHIQVYGTPGTTFDVLMLPST